MFAVEWPLIRATFQEEGKEEVPTSILSPAFQKLELAKQKVPELRRRIGSSRWNALVNAYGKEDTLVASSSSRLASRAYHKMREILLTCGIPTPRCSVHLCECPGGFVQYIGDRVREDELEFGEALPWKWVALSRPEPPEPVTSVLPMDRGVFLRVDVHDCDEALDGALDGRCADLITADGAFDADHSTLERDHFSLLLSQSRVALRCLAPEGTFVIKFFEGGLLATQKWIAWLTHRFEHVGLIKLNSSRPTNSERYLVARGFDGNREGPLVPPSTMKLAPSWKTELQILVDRMAEDQCQHLERVFQMAQRN